MAVVRGETDEVARILDQFPDSLLEIDIYGQTRLHLAAAKPIVLSLLVEAADDDILDRLDMAGISAIEVAMMRSGDRCINGTSTKRCRGSGCTEFVEILFKAVCDLRTCRFERLNVTGIRLHEILEPASELAKHRYIFELQKRMVCGMQASREPWSGGFVSSDINSIRGSYDEVGQRDWVYDEIHDIHMADLFYRYGFRPDPFTLLDVLRTLELFEYDMNDSIVAYVGWLVYHGVDLLAQVSTGPRENDPDIRLFLAHYAFWAIGECLWSTTRTTDGPELGNLATFNEYSTTVMCQTLTDGCQCHCSADGCSPFIWMLKGLRQRGAVVGKIELHMIVL